MKFKNERFESLPFVTEDLIRFGNLSRTSNKQIVLQSKDIYWETSLTLLFQRKTDLINSRE